MAMVALVAVTVVEVMVAAEVVTVVVPEMVAMVALVGPSPLLTQSRRRDSHPRWLHREGLSPWRGLEAGEAVPVGVGRSQVAPHGAQGLRARPCRRRVCRAPRKTCIPLHMRGHGDARGCIPPGPGARGCVRLTGERAQLAGPENWASGQERLLLPREWTAAEALSLQDSMPHTARVSSV